MSRELARELHTAPRVMHSKRPSRSHAGAPITARSGHATADRSEEARAPRSQSDHARAIGQLIPPPQSWLWLCGLVASALIVVFAFRMLMALFGGVMVALLLRAPSRWISRVLHVRYGVALALVMIVMLGSIALVIVLAAPTIAEQWTSLTEELPKMVTQLRRKLAHLPLVSGAPQAPQGHGATKGVDIVGMAISTLGGSIEALSGLVIACFIGLYGAAQPAIYKRVALQLAPRAHRDRVEAMLASSSTNLTRWLWGRLIAMAFVGITTTVLFQVFGLPLAVGLGVLAGTLTFIEYAGAVISAIPPILIASTQSASMALAVGALFTVLHIVEGYVLTPLLARATVHLPPAITLGTQAVFGTLAGAMGLTFSTPLLIVAVSCAEASKRFGPLQLTNAA